MTVINGYNIILKNKKHYGRSEDFFPNNLGLYF